MPKSSSKTTIKSSLLVQTYSRSIEPEIPCFLSWLSWLLWTSICCLKTSFLHSSTQSRNKFSYSLFSVCSSACLLRILLFLLFRSKSFWLNFSIFFSCDWSYESKNLIILSSIWFWVRPYVYSLRIKGVMSGSLTVTLICCTACLYAFLSF